MVKQSTLQIVQELLVEEFDLPPEQVHAGARLRELGIDSLAAIEFMFVLEDRFKVPGPEERAAVETVGDIAQQIDYLVAQQRRSAPERTAVDR